MRRFIILLVMFLGGLFFVSNFARLERVAFAVRQGNWTILGIAVAFVVLWLINLAALYRSIYRGLGVREQLRPLLVISTASMFVNVVTPGGLLGGVALFVDQASRSGYSVAKATLVGLLQLVFDLLAFAVVLVVGLGVLFRRNDLSPTTLTASVILFAVAGLLLFLFILGMQSGEKLSRALAAIARFVNRLLRPILKRNYLSEENAVERGMEAASGLEEMRAAPGHLFLPFLLALNGKAIQMVVFWLIFVSFKVEHSAGTIVSGFCIAFLFMVVSPSPVGIGVVETLLPLTLNAMFVPLDAAVVITLTYRGLTFWLPMVLGMISVRFVHLFDRKPVPIRH